MKTGILLINLGTPDSPSPRDVYRYLIEFLTDERVINFPTLWRQLLVRGLIVPRRYQQSARSYRAIWTPEGSPLKVYGQKVQQLLQRQIGDDYLVELAMRYRHPSIAKSLDKFRQQPLAKLVVLPLFPHYASATTGSVCQKVMEIICNWEVIPELRFVGPFATHPAYIDALCAMTKPFHLSTYDHILFSYHGLPESQANSADYSAQCQATMTAVVQQLSLPRSQYSHSFQSRLGKDPWLQPYTSDTLKALAHRGCKRVLVFSPSFVCDCLETTYEIGIEYAAEFRQAGGEILDLVPGLNTHPQWIAALASLIE